MSTLWTCSYEVLLALGNHVDGTIWVNTGQSDNITLPEENTDKTCNVCLQFLV